MGLKRVCCRLIGTGWCRVNSKVLRASRLTARSKVARPRTAAFCRQGWPRQPGPVMGAPGYQLDSVQDWMSTCCRHDLVALLRLNDCRSSAVRRRPYLLYSGATLLSGVGA